MAACGTAMTPAEPDADSTTRLARSFPTDFLWGTATSAYQIEGAVAEDGRGESIWDRFAHTPGRIRNGDTGDVACDHYHRYADDLDLIANLGLRAYRFSVAWPRVLPEGEGRVNPAGIGFYRRLIEGLLERGVKPVPTLYHWDLPQALQERGGWANRDTAHRYAAYAELMARELGDLAPIWLTQNEPWVAAFFGNTFDLHAPGGSDPATGFRVAHHLLLGHGMAVQALRATLPATAQVGIAVDLYQIDPHTQAPRDLDAARLMDGWRNRLILDPLLRGHYPEDVLDAYATRWGEPDWLVDGDLAQIATPIDLLGVNFYSRSVVEAGGPDDLLGIRIVPPAPPLTATGWEVVPDALTTLLLRLRADYGPIPIVITENGAAFADALEGGEIADADRMAFLRQHVAAVARARAAGADVRGYFVWSLMDNFEWSEGYSKRFGLIHVDFVTQERRPKASARWYRELIAASSTSVPRAPAL